MISTPTAGAVAGGLDVPTSEHQGAPRKLQSGAIGQHLVDIGRRGASRPLLLAVGVEHGHWFATADPDEVGPGPNGAGIVEVGAVLAAGAADAPVAQRLGDGRGHEVFEHRRRSNRKPLDATVPAECAGDVARQMISAGCRAVW